MFLKKLLGLTKTRYPNKMKRMQCSQLKKIIMQLRS